MRLLPDESTTGRWCAVARRTERARTQAEGKPTHLQAIGVASLREVAAPQGQARRLRRCRLLPAPVPRPNRLRAYHLDPRRQDLTTRLHAAWVMSPDRPHGISNAVAEGVCVLRARDRASPFQAAETMSVYDTAPGIRHGAAEECLITRTPYHGATAWTRRTDRRFSSGGEASTERDSTSPRARLTPR